MLSRDQILAQMRERVHHPAGTRELLQLLKIPREERAVVQTPPQRARRRRRPDSDSRRSASACPRRWTSTSARLQTHAAGYGFVVPERPLESGGDIYIAGPHLNEAMHGDRVVARIERVKDGGRVEGPHHPDSRARATARLVGRYDRDDDGMGFVVPFDRRVLMDILIPAGQEGGASPGEMVTVELTRWPTSTRGAIGRVAEVLGDIDAPGRRHRDHHPQVRDP